MTIPTTIIVLATVWFLLIIAIQILDLIDAAKREIRGQKICRYCEAAYDRGQKQTHIRLACPRASVYYTEKVQWLRDRDPNAFEGVLAPRDNAM